MITFRDGVVLTPQEKRPSSEKESAVLSEGITKKQLMVNQEMETFLAKSPDPLLVKEVFRGYIPEKALETSTHAMQKHVFSLEFELSFIEVLMPRLMKALFKEEIVTPDVYLHVDKENHIFVLSKLLDGFDEFLHSKVTHQFGNILEHDDIPTREQLQLTEEEAYLIGQLYAAALIFNHWDILNSKLLNAGSVASHSRNTACIVDFGFCAHLSYKGRHTDSLCLDDENFAYGKKIQYRFFSQKYNQDYRHRFALPFDTKVGALLPHTLIEDLYQLSGTNKISIAMRQGFARMIRQADDSISHNPDLYQEVLNDCLQRISKESLVTAEQLPEHLNMTFYSDGKSDSDTLYAILKGRVKDCFRLLERFEKQEEPCRLHEEARDGYYRANLI